MQIVYSIFLAFFLLFCSVVSSVAMPRSLQSSEIGDNIIQYAKQGIHLTGSNVDAQSAKWMQHKLQALQYKQVQLFPIKFKRTVLVQAHVTVGSKTIKGFPLFSGGVTPSWGITGKLGLPGDAADIVVVNVPVSVTANGSKLFSKLRRSKRYKAIIAVTQGNSPGLAFLNVKTLKNSGLPVLQVASTDGYFLRQAAVKHHKATLTLTIKKVQSTAYDVIASLPGKNPALKPILITVPRSAWTPAAGEHGGPVACWLALAKSLRQAKPLRTVNFIAFTGHEIGYLGFVELLKTSQQYLTGAAAWLHLGTNLGTLPLSALQITSTQSQYMPMIEKIAHAYGINNWQANRRALGEAGYAMRHLTLNLPIFAIATDTNLYYHMLKDTGSNVKPDITAKYCSFYNALALQLANKPAQ